MITIEHKEEYINGEKVKEFYNIVGGSIHNMYALSIQDLQELYDKLGEIINKKP